MSIESMTSQWKPTTTAVVMSIEPGQIRSECYTNDATDDGQFDYCNTTPPLRSRASLPLKLDPSAAADRRIRRRMFVRRKSAGKITARRISRRILLAVNPP